MKTGDSIPVNIAGDVVAQATVTEIDKDNNRVTLVVPATKVVMGLRVELDTAPPAPVEPTVQTIITGVDRYDAEGNIIEGASTGDGASAPVVETVNSANAASSATPTPEGTATATELVAAVPVEPVVSPVEAPANNG